MDSLNTPYKHNSGQEMSNFEMLIYCQTKQDMNFKQSNIYWAKEMKTMKRQNERKDNVL